MSRPGSNCVAGAGKGQNRAAKQLENCLPMKSNSIDNQMFLILHGDFFKSICKGAPGFQISQTLYAAFHLDHPPPTGVETIPCHQIRRLSCTILTAIMTTIFGILIPCNK